MAVSNILTTKIIHIETFQELGVFLTSFILYEASPRNIFFSQTGRVPKEMFGETMSF